MHPTGTITHDGLNLFRLGRAPQRTILTDFTPMVRTLLFQLLLLLLLLLLWHMNRGASQLRLFGHFRSGVSVVIPGGGIWTTAVPNGQTSSEPELSLVGPITNEI